MKGIYKFLSDTDDVIAVVDGMNAGLKEQLVSGLVGSARALYAASLYERSGRRPLLLITYNLLQAQKLYDDLLQLLPGESIRLYPSNELSVADMMIASPELRAERIDTLNALCDGEKGILIVPIAGLRRMLPPRDLWKKYLFKWRMDDRLDLQETAGHLVRMGYTRVPMVSAPGEFSIRGGILDVYPLTEDYPVRLELFDDVIDSIRYFSIENQRSLEKIQEIVLGPAREMIFEKEHMESVIRKLKEQLKVSLQRIRDEKVKEVLIQQTEYDIGLLSAGEIPDDMFKYLSFAYEKPASLLDYIPEDSFICIDEVSRVLEIKNSIDKEEGEWKIGLLSEGKIMHGAEISHPIWDLLLHSPFPIVYFSLFLRHVPSISPQNIVNMTARPMQNFHGQMPVLKAEMNRWQQGKFTVVILGSDESRVAKLERVFADYDFQNIVVNESGEVLLPERVQIVKGNLANGFELPIHRFCVITEEEIFNKRAKRTVKSRQKMSNAERIQSHSQLQIGDYVVHVNHGIGKYMGIRTLEINGVHKDYLQIKYQGNDKLYVPVEQIDFVQKYVGTEGKEPKLSKLGGSEWKRVKRKVAANVQDIAEDLIQLYAERQATKGFAFSPDTELQREFEAAFPYKETEDQLRSIEEIKRDMEKPRPMDRLLCGDVGYGKTEVALRAAFKAMMDGKQVAFLVPTTILAQQHYETMRERFQDYPIKIGLLSRFRTRKEQQETIKGLKNGTIDIVVGTHRLLSKDVKFHDLGLLIIDEEQRFGVAHKEKIKKLKTNVDVLTLTATPIPRTLHMSLLGVRDLSIIETPPENRFPVQTYVMEYSPALVKEAIERELARGGQVYYLYNHVEDIERKADEVANLVPDARVVYAHGRMNETQLENVMISFLNGEYDVLVSTTIIESGVDIPNVNTLIVENADRLGLSQLYQLRGRVGRSSRVAYAYFTFQKDKVLSEVAEKRLQTIKEFTELGSGFKIAMRDLSIRGTGNILGPQQHGFIESVGFELYSQMLKEAIERLKGEKKEEEWEVEINLEVDAYIPDSYISDGFQKIEMYKRFRGIETLDDWNELEEDMVDRFGNYPKEVERLFQIAKIKLFANTLHVETINQEKDQIDIIFRDGNPPREMIGSYVERLENFGRQISYGQKGSRFVIALQNHGLPATEMLPLLERVLVKLADHDENSEGLLSQIS